MIARLDGSDLEKDIVDKFNYSYHRTRDWKYYEVYLKRFRENPNPILELGSGIGLFLEACRQNNVRATGVEFEAEGVQESVKNGLSARQHDLSNPLDFFDNDTFEAIFSNQVIEHLSPEAQVNMINESYRLLRPGGQVLVSSPCRHWEPARLDKYHIGLLTPSELKTMLERAGFRDCNMGYNRRQEIPELPDDVLSSIWHKYRPDQLSKDATVLAYKPI